MKRKNLVTDTWEKEKLLEIENERKKGRRKHKLSRKT